MMPDPNRPYGINTDQNGHPYLPAGENSAFIAGDEINGAGRWDVAPSLCQSTESHRVLVLESEDFEAITCITAVIPAENRRIGVGAENRTVVMSRRCA